MDAELLLLLFFLLNLVFEHVRSERDIISNPPVFFCCNSKTFEFLTVIFKKKQFRRRLFGMRLRGSLQCNMTHCFICLFKFQVDQLEGPID